MRITLQVEGGIAHLPGLARPVTIDTTSLPAQEAAHLEELVRSAQFFARPARIGDTAGRADYRTYTLSVENGAHAHTVKVLDPVSDASLQALIDALQARRGGSA